MACLTFRELALKQLGESTAAHLHSWLEELVVDRTPWPLVGVAGWHWEGSGASWEEGGTLFYWKTQWLLVLWKLNCSESRRIMEFRVVNCHGAGLELLWYDPDIALWFNSILKGSMEFGIMVWMSVWKELLVKGSVETTAASFEHSPHGWIYFWGMLKLSMLQDTNMTNIYCTGTVYMYCFIRCVVLSNSPVGTK